MNACRLKILGILNAKKLSNKSTMYLNTNLINFHLFQLKECSGNNTIIIDKVAIHAALRANQVNIESLF